MQYFGGKQRIAKEIVEFLENNRNNKPYYEPFVGGASILSSMKGKRFASDINEYLIELYVALQNGWIPPDHISEIEYDFIKKNKDNNKALTGFVGIGCSYSGKWFGGLSKNNTNRNYVLNAKNSLLKALPLIKDVTFKCIDYRKANPNNLLIYCDPPYRGYTGYDFIGNKFDNEEFWKFIRKWSKNNLVFVSEYSAPEDFKCVWKKETKLDIKNKNGEKEKRIEKLFIYNKT